MLTKTVTYTDYNGVERTEDYLFNLTEAEIMELELSVSGGWVEYINRIIAGLDGPAISKVFKQMLLDAYGIKSPDGKRFIKSEELKNEFSQTPAYSILYMELVTDSNKASEFINNIIPQNNSKDIAVSAQQTDQINVSAIAPTT